MDYLLQNGGTATFSGIVFQNPVDGFIDSERQEMLLTANLNSFEFNYVIGGRPARDRLVMQPDGRWSRFATPSKVRGFYVGLRYIRQNESFRYQGFGRRQTVAVFEEDELGEIVFEDLDNDEDTPDTPVASGSRIASIPEGGTYRVNTDNDLIGIQFGSDMVAKRTDWVFGLNGKIGGMMNFADRRSSLLQRFETIESLTGRNVVPITTATNNPEDDAILETRSTSEELNDETLTFLSEVNVYVSYYLRPNTSFRVGYNVLYMNGLATALDNVGIQGNTFNRFEVTGDSLYHGMNLGFETTW